MNITTLSKLSTDHYNIKNWTDKYKDKQINIYLEIKKNSNWKYFFDLDIINKELDKINKMLNNEKATIYPYPRLVFSALNTLPLKKIKVVILGQDPYINDETVNEKVIPQAMGLSLSVPKGITIPPSLKNIYNNLLKNGHIKSMPPHGNLTQWHRQGCMLLNTALTVRKGKSNSHSKYWSSFTNNLIEYISNNTDNIVFVLWGGKSLEKEKLIDTKKHKIIVSSHPSPLSYTKSLKKYDSFAKSDCFGGINEYLISKGNKPINWKIT